MSFNIESAILLANSGGTAFPTCFICETFGPTNSKVSGNDCILAASRTVIALFKYGCVNLPDDGVSNLVVIVTLVNIPFPVLVEQGLSVLMQASND